MMDTEPRYRTGGPVWPETMAEWGRTGEIPPPDDREVYASPGRPPWAPAPQRRGLPAWAWVSIVLGSLFLCLGGSLALALVDQSGPAPVVGTETAEPTGPVVTASGTCEKRLLGSYGLVATVTATNTSKDIRSGTVWVKWPVTGEASQRFSERLTLAPGQAVEFPVNQEITAARWFQVGACSFGWTPEGER
jgi:hypothetical protein